MSGRRSRWRVCNAGDGGKSRRVEPLIFAHFSEGRVTNPSAEMEVGRFYWQEGFPENQPFVCGWVGRSLSSEARWVGASINGAAGIRCCDLRYPESVGIIRVASSDGEQEMIADFPPQIQDSLSISGRPADNVLPAFAVRGNVPLGDSPIAHGHWRADGATSSSKVVVDIA